MIFQAACIGILITMCLALVRAFLGPTVFDRILAVNMFGTKTVGSLVMNTTIYPWLQSRKEIPVFN